MSYPSLKATQDYSNIEVREYHKYANWEQMNVMYTGAILEGGAWSGREGGRLCVKCSNNPGDLSNQPAFCASGFLGISEGKAEVTEF